MKQIKEAKVTGKSVRARNNSQSIVWQAAKRYFSGSILAIAFLLLFSALASAQTNGSNIKFTQGEVNESATLSLGVPLGNYPGRGLDLPVSLSYSSSVWRLDHINTVKNYNTVYNPQYVTQSVTQAIYSEYSTAGWNSSFDLPKIEFPKTTDTYVYNGKASIIAVSPGCDGYRIAKVIIHMPDGSSHELRKSDVPNQLGYVDMSGTFYATDGSRMRFDGTGADTGTLYMADGTRYVLGHPSSQIIDRNGNTQTYNETTRQWTDTLGRTIVNPIPANPQAQDYTYTLPGLSGVLTYTFKWRNLADALTPDDNNVTPSLRYAATHYLPTPASVPNDTSNFPQAQSSTYDHLFHSEYVFNIAEQGNSIVPTIVVGKGQSAGQLFNPVVLTEVVLPNGTKYKFSYNVYGEIDKVVYPTGAYEKYQIESPDNSTPIPDEVASSQPYVQTERRIKSRKLSVNGTGNDTAEWKYSETYGSSYGTIDSGGKTKVTSIIAPDNTRTEITKRYISSSGGGFGGSNPLSGVVLQRKSYSTSTDGLGGNLLRRELTEYAMTNIAYQQTAQCGATSVTLNYSTARNARPTKSISVIFEGSGSALAQTSTFAYDTTYEMSTGIDQIQTATYDYAAVDNTPAQTGTISAIPLGSLARYSETEYRNDAVFRNNNILGLGSVSKLKDSAGTIVSQSEMLYDESNYLPASVTGRALPTSSRVWDSTKGLVTNPAAYLTTHAKFDTYGNRIEATDAKGITTFTEYDATYHAFPTKVTTAVPDPNPSSNPDGLAHGSSTAFESTITYDTSTPPLGLPITTTDANGQTATMDYDAYLRPKKVTPPAGAGISETIYNDTPGNIWVKSRAQIDATNWAESITYYDGIGRAYKTEKIDSQGNVFTESEFDQMGRVKRSTNPYKATETKIWTTPEYDNLGRVITITSPDGAITQSSFGISTAAGFIGATKQITDQAGKKRKGITDGLGRMIRVIEDPDGQNLATDYVFDTLGNLHKTIQGEQSRYFMYDSLGRLLYAKQPEQEANALFTATDAITNNSSWSVKYEYDDSSNITKTIDARNVSVTGSYDKFNRLIYRDYSDSNTPDVGFFYDGKGLSAVPDYSKGKTTKVSSSVSETRYTSFDNLGRLLTSQQLTTAAQRNGTENPYTSSYTYNLSGALLTETYPSGRVITNTLNADGELSKVESQKNATATNKLYLSDIKYNSFGAVEQARLGNGRWETTQYDVNRLQIKQIALGNSNTDKSLLKIDYDYGTTAQNNGSLKGQTITYAGQSSQIVQSYAYDSLNRLQSATETFNTSQQAWKQTFDYDRFGNRTFNTANGGTTTLDPSKATKVTNPQINTSDNRLKKDQDNDTVTDYDYDKAGNMTLDAENKRFVYDAENHQTQFFGSANTTQTPDAVYQYDGEGKRIRKISGQTETIFVYNSGGQLAAEYSTQISQTPQASYLTSDSLGSPRMVTDGGGAIISRHDYMAFGDEIYTNTGGRTTTQKYSAIDNIREQYTGYERDTESGLDFAQARYYNSAHGRFTSVDPLTASATIRNPQTFNRYSYVTNSPYKFVDPLGLALIDAGIFLTSDPTLPGKLDRVWRAGQLKASQQPPSPLCPRGHMCFGEQAQQGQQDDTVMSPSERWLAGNFGDSGTYFSNPNDGDPVDQTIGEARNDANARNDPENHMYGSMTDPDVKSAFYIPKGGKFIGQGTYTESGGGKSSYALIYFAELGGLKNVTVAVFHMVNITPNSPVQKDGRRKLGEMGPGMGGGWSFKKMDEKGRFIYKPSFHFHLEIYRGRKTSLPNRPKPHFNFNGVVR
jgi:RHS repeat-associated protein